MNSPVKLTLNKKQIEIALLAIDNAIYALQTHRPEHKDIAALEELSKYIKNKTQS